MCIRDSNSLRAELHRRETVFRELGVSDYHDAAVRSAEPLARLVIVIDEFAALATDYPDLMASIIDLAARGRSLGMHLVLATQRPSGVVDQKIRANTNLRIALRVQDAFDSQDVIGIGDAADIDRKAPGRAIFRVGGDEAVTVQTAYSGAPDTRTARCTVRAHQLFGLDGGPTSGYHSTSLGRTDRATAKVATELDVLLDAIHEVSASRQSRARALWSDPLPAALDWIDLGARSLGIDGQLDSGDMVGGVPLGLVDLPERQTQLPWKWNLDSGALAIFGASAECCGKALLSLSVHRLHPPTAPKPRTCTSSTAMPVAQRHWRTLCTPVHTSPWQNGTGSSAPWHCSRTRWRNDEPSQRRHRRRRGSSC